MDKNKTKIYAIVAFLALLLSMMTALIPNQTAPMANAQTQSNVPSNSLQYEWPDNLAGDKELGWRVGGGPAPSTPDIMWELNLGYPVAAFNGLLFLSGGRAVDPYTGALVYKGSFGIPTKINQNYFYSGSSVYETATGRLIYGYNQTITNYDPTIGMFFTSDAQTGGGGGPSRIQGWNWPDISKAPTLAWDKYIYKNYRGAALTVADGRIMFGTLECTAMALDCKTGNLLWETPVKGYFGYDAAYYQGKWVQASLSGELYCFNATNGAILWEYDPNTFYGYWAFMGAIYNNKIYNINTDNHVYAIDMETGQLAWKWKTTNGGVGYQTYTIAGDGKVYAYTGRSDYIDPETGKQFNEEYVCLDAETGQFLWKTNAISGSSREFGGPPSIYNVIAYGRLYLGDWRGTTACYGPPQSPLPWSNFQADPEHTGDAKRDGPTDLNIQWVFDGDSAFLAAPAAAYNKIYIGSTNGTFYALDHSTGNSVWSFRTGGSIKSSPAIADGKVFFVSEDGYHYALNAETGAQIWKTYIGADTPFLYKTLQRRTSSPCVVEGKIYVGSTDFNVYCLDAANGNVNWKFNAKGLISCTPAVSNGSVYFAAGGISDYLQSKTGGDNATMFKLNAANGNLIWQSGLPYSRHKGSGQLVGRELHGSPTVVGDTVYQSGNAWLVFAIDANTGAHKWVFNSTLMEHTVTAALPNDITNVYADGKLYVQDFFRLACIDAKTGVKLWDQWLGHNWHGGPVFANGKIYAASELMALYVIDANTGAKLDDYAWGDFCWSSPAVYDNKLYWGTLGMKVYCFEQGPYGIVSVYPSVNATLSTGQITKGDSVVVSGMVNPAVANVAIDVHVVDPNSNTADIVATTAADGTYRATYTPPVEGTYAITAVTLVDDAVSTKASGTLSLTVVKPPAPSSAPASTASPAPALTPAPTPTPQPTLTASPSVVPEPEAAPSTDIYIIAAAAAVIIVVVVVAAVMLRKRK